MDIFEELQKIFQRGKNQWGNFESFDSVTGDSIETLVTDFLEEAVTTRQIKDFSIDTCSFDCGPASEPGACFIAWVESNGKLNSTMYEWLN